MGSGADSLIWIADSRVVVQVVHCQARIVVGRVVVVAVDTPVVVVCDIVDCFSFGWKDREIKFRVFSFLHGCTISYIILFFCWS